MTPDQLRRMEQGRKRAAVQRQREQRQAVQAWRAWCAKSTRMPWVEALRCMPPVPRDSWYEA